MGAGSGGRVAEGLGVRVGAIAQWGGECALGVGGEWGEGGGTHCINLPVFCMFSVGFLKKPSPPPTPPDPI